MKKLILLFLSFLFWVKTKSATVETEHFIFHGIKNDLSKEIISFCEDQYDLFVKKLNRVLKGKIVINVYPSIKAYQKAVNLKHKNDCDIASINKNEIHIVSVYIAGTIHNEQSIKASLSSKIGKVILYNGCNLSKWLIDAIGFYEKIKFLQVDEKKIYADAFERLLKDEYRFKLSDVIYFNIVSCFEKKTDLGPALQKIFENKALCNSFIEFIIHEWGYGFLLKMEKDTCVSSLFNMCINELEKFWIKFVKSNY